MICILLYGFGYNKPFTLEFILRYTYQCYTVVILSLPQPNKMAEQGLAMSELVWPEWGKLSFFSQVDNGTKITRIVLFCCTHTYHTVCVQIFVGLYFRKFHKSIGDCKNNNTKMCTHTVQDCCCRPPFAK